MLVIMMKTKSNEATTPIDTNRAVLLIIDSSHISLRSFSYDGAAFNWFDAVVFREQLEDKGELVSNIVFTKFLAFFCSYLLHANARSMPLVSTSSLLQNRLHTSLTSIDSQCLP